MVKEGTRAGYQDHYGRGLQLIVGEKEDMSSALYRTSRGQVPIKVGGERERQEHLHQQRRLGNRLGKFKSLVTIYATRNLSRASDAIDAFAGVLDVFRDLGAHR